MQLTEYEEKFVRRMYDDITEQRRLMGLPPKESYDSARGVALELKDIDQDTFEHMYGMRRYYKDSDGQLKYEMRV